MIDFVCANAFPRLCCNIIAIERAVLVYLLCAGGVNQKSIDKNRKWQTSRCLNSKRIMKMKVDAASRLSIVCVLHDKSYSDNSLNDKTFCLVMQSIRLYHFGNY